jgi:hypothetical protein
VAASFSWAPLTLILTLPSLHRRRPGNRAVTRNPALKNRAAMQIHLIDVFHPCPHHGLRRIKLM